LISASSATEDQGLISASSAIEDQGLISASTATEGRINLTIRSLYSGHNLLLLIEELSIDTYIEKCTLRILRSSDED